MERLTYRGSETMTEEDGWIRPSPEEGTVYSCYSTRKIIERLAEYEDLEEKGLLLRLPCKVGSTVYAICTCEAVGTVLDGTLYGSNGLLHSIICTSGTPQASIILRLTAVSLLLPTPIVTQ